MTPHLAVLMGLFLLVMAGVTAAGVWLNGRAKTQTAVVSGPVVSGPNNGMRTALQWVGDQAPAAAKQFESPVRRRLFLAGYRDASAPSIFRGLKYVSVVIFAIAGVFAGSLNDGNGIIGGLCMGGLGFMLPDQILAKLASRRLKRLRLGLPAALDLMVLSVEAGQSLDTAILETARGLRTTYPEIAAELSLLNVDLRANTSRMEAMKTFGERSGEPEIKKFSNLLIDTDRFGTSLAPALRNHARYLRTRSRQQAQEKARKVGVKLIFPVFFLIFPSVILVTLGPAVIMVSTQLTKYLAM